MSAPGCCDDCGQCVMTEYFESLQQHRNLFASGFAGVMFAIGWWFIIDASIVDSVIPAHHTVGVFSTVGLVMVNSVSPQMLEGDVYTDGKCGSGGAKVTLIFGLMMSFGCLIAGIWLMAQEYIEKSQGNEYAGVCLMLQNLMIFLSSMMFKFGRTEESAW
eukprot:m.333529 g.333529  ORF g.333529 m.333529 type:complete len:160 (+) comp17166_c0_seq1:171-650(+)